MHLDAGGTALPIVSRMASAQAYPTRPVRIIVGFPTGSNTDIQARLIGQWLSERLGQPFVIENRLGAGGNIAAETVVRAPADGHTPLLIAANNAINASLYHKLNFNVIRDIAPVASVSRTSLVMEVHPSVPVQTIPEFIAYSKSNPGKIAMASAGNGTPQHVSGELFKMMAGLDMLHVPYRGAPQALTDLIGGRVQVMFDVIPTSLEHINAGRLRPLGVTTATRLDVLPDIPTVGDFLPGFEASGWAGLGTPKNTPTQIIENLNKQINAGLADAKIKATIADMGSARFSSSPAEFGKFISDETEKWAKVIKFAGIMPE